MMRWTEAQIATYRQLGFSDLDLALGDWMLRHHSDHPAPEALAYAAMLVNAALRAGHTGIDPFRLPAAATLLDLQALEATQHEALEHVLSAPKRLVEQDQVVMPLAYEHGRLYFSRYRDYEAELARDLTQRIQHGGHSVDRQTIEQVRQLFDPAPEGQSAWQTIAALSALRHRFAVVSGGPGTGKTYTVVRLLGALLTQDSQLRMAVAAPTGKAAARLKTAMDAGVAALNVTDTLKQQLLCIEASTLHRLLGFQSGRIDFRHDRHNPLPLDVLVIDEASMVDLPLLSKTVRALPASARLILVGDRYQLASVENGDVLSAITELGGDNAISDAWRQTLGDLLADDAQAPAPEPLGDAVTTLKHSRRFAPDSGIARLAGAVNADDPQALMDALDHDDGSVLLRPINRPQALQALLQSHARALASSLQANAVAGQLQSRQLLTPQRLGERGVETLNTILEAELRPENSQAHWYPGRPVMITRNDYRHGLFNGDVGLTLRDERGLGVFFEQPGEPPRRFLPATLPVHETALAMTVHKSQGSEFDHVVLVLPEHDHPLLTRELIYTAITRARQRIEIWGHASVLEAAIQRRSQRQSGLAARLRQLLA
jgi:exodeoxyribonuclease V alpha subunit